MENIQNSKTAILFSNSGAVLETNHKQMSSKRSQQLRSCVQIPLNGM